AAHHTFTTYAHSEVLEVSAACGVDGKTRQLGYAPLRTTRSGAAFSNYYTVNNPEFDLDCLLDECCRDGAECDEEEPVGADVEDGWTEDEGPASGTSSPLSSLPPSCAASRTPSPAPSSNKRPRPESPPPNRTPATRAGQRPPLAHPSRAGTATATGKHKASKKKNSRKSRQRQAQRRAGEGNWAPPPANLLRNARHLADANFLEVPLNWDAQPVTSTGFTAKREEGEKKTYALDDFIGPKAKVQGFKLINWNGSEPSGLVANDGRVFGVLAGHPDDPKWQETHEGLADEIAKGAARASFPASSKDHRRGKFGAEAHGASHGGGQTAPGVLKHTKGMTKVLLYLIGLSSMIRIAHFASAVFFNWAPALWTFYADHMRILFENDPTLRRNFARSIWACITINFGLRTVTFKHRDFGNLPFGWCAITALGRFDPDRGGHLVLWECELVIRFPPGSTIIIPSAIINHSNTVIGGRETRYSVTQYTAGAIFRWVQHGCKLDEAYYDSLSESEALEAKRANARRWREGVKLWSKIEDLQSRAQEIVHTLGTK
ncbi:hypothetical protein HDZ31DRAFT_46760, partial [Schizophyllum fasciatum]